MLNSIGRMFGNLKLRTVISGLVICSILASIAAVSVGMYLNLSTSVMAKAKERQGSNMHIAATILAGNVQGTNLAWDEAGNLTTISLWAIMPFFDNVMVDAIARVTGGDASIYIMQHDTGDVLAKTTTLMRPDGTRAIDEAIDRDGPIYAALIAGKVYEGEELIFGDRYLTAYQPLMKQDGTFTGVMFVGQKLSDVERSIGQNLQVLLLVGAAATIIVGAIGYFLSRMITAPIPKLARTMENIAEGDLNSEVPYVNLGSEVGVMARTVEVFRNHGLQVAQLTDEERAGSLRRRAERIEMMQSLQMAFGEVVDAAVGGDFSKRVGAQFPDDELNALASSVNRLVETVDRGLTETGDVLAALAETDLTRRVNGHYQGAFAKLKDDTNAVGDKLTDIVSQLRDTSRSLKTATGEILAGANDLSERTTKQAATIEETSATMEQLANTVTKNANRATEASAAADGVTRTAEAGGLVMGQANEAMERITTSSAKISNIIGMIDDIAFQTNLLALNASVEAARAGEAGKGFAVVAVEVRRLAQSAAQASKEVKILIDQSAEEVRGGSKLVADAAEKLSSMVEAARRNNGLIDSIAQESRAQAASIDEVNVAVRLMDEMTQHNAALVEQTNAAIEQTEAQATELDRIVDIFTLTDAGPTALPQPKPNAHTGIKGLQDRVKTAARSYLTKGNAAVKQDWSEF